VSPACDSKLRGCEPCDWDPSLAFSSCSNDLLGGGRVSTQGVGAACASTGNALWAALDAHDLTSLSVLRPNAMHPCVCLSRVRERAANNAVPGYVGASSRTANNVASSSPSTTPQWQPASDRACVIRNLRHGPRHASAHRHTNPGDPQSAAFRAASSGLRSAPQVDEHLVQRCESTDHRHMSERPARINPMINHWRALKGSAVNYQSAAFMECAVSPRAGAPPRISPSEQ
jgi:hypothetical protein